MFVNGCWLDFWYFSMHEVIQGLFGFIFIRCEISVASASMFCGFDCGAFLLLLFGNSVWEWRVAMGSMANQAACAGGLRGCTLATVAQSNTSKKMKSVCMTPLLSSTSFYSSKRLQSCALSKPRRATAAPRSALEAPKAAKEKKAKENAKKASEEVVGAAKENGKKASEAATAIVEVVAESAQETAEALKENVEKAPELVKETVENAQKTPEIFKEDVEVAKESVQKAVEATTEAAKEVTQVPELKRQLTRTRSFHHPRGGNIKADPLRVIMFQVHKRIPWLFLLSRNLWSKKQGHWK